MYLNSSANCEYLGLSFNFTELGARLVGVGGKCYSDHYEVRSVLEDEYTSDCEQGYFSTFQFEPDNF